MSAAQDAVVAYALSLEGLTAPDPAYLALAAPAEEAAGDDAAAKQVAKVSDCILVRMGIEEACFDVPERARYVFSTAGTLIMHRDAGAEIYILKPAFADLALGDGLHWGPSPIAPEHFETVVDISEDGETITVIAGGQRSGILETIKKLTRKVSANAIGLVDISDQRRLIARISADGMAAKYGLKAA